MNQKDMKPGELYKLSGNHKIWIIIFRRFGDDEVKGKRNRHQSEYFFADIV
ncbi:unnamed protein product, partial [marine sediment metagenome]